ncbi:MAG TPA: SDR family oxidoreductase [Gemmatimonadaceae bacterium]|nr:SDR family oxidoreductase [Gemmatimonadaceae bacterium]
MSGAQLAGRRVVVTGASRGIGLAIATTLAAAGARLTLLARDVRSLEKLAARLDAVPIPCDVGNAAAVDRAIAAIESNGGAPDILVNNAGLFRPSPVDATTPEALAAALEVNLIAPFRLVRAFLPAMLERGRGDIVSIGSVADHATFPENAAYGASKHGLRALHEVMRTELRGTGVRVTLISPGPVDTSLWDEIDPDSREGFTPRSRMLPPNAVASTVLFAVTQPPEVDVELVRLARS